MGFRLPLLLLFLAVCFFSINLALEILPFDEWKNDRVLFISAHPDDIEASNGGLIAQLTQQGTQVFYLIATNGDKGCFNEMCLNWTSAQIASARAVEAVNAAQVLSVPKSNVFLLGYGDAMMTSYADAQVREAFITVIRKVQPHVVITWHLYPDLSLLPSEGWDDLGYHADHQSVGRYALDAFTQSGVSRLFPNAGPAWLPRDFFLWTFSSGTHYVDISNFLPIKIQSYLQHKTQCPNQTIVEQLIPLLAQMTAQKYGVPGFIEGLTKFS